MKPGLRLGVGLLLLLTNLVSNPTNASIVGDEPSPPSYIECKYNKISCYLSGVSAVTFACS